MLLTMSLRRKRDLTLLVFGRGEKRGLFDSSKRRKEEGSLLLQYGHERKSLVLCLRERREGPQRDERGEGGGPGSYGDGRKKTVLEVQTEGKGRRKDRRSRGRRSERERECPGGGRERRKKRFKSGRHIGRRGRKERDAA